MTDETSHISSAAHRLFAQVERPNLANLLLEALLPRHQTPSTSTTRRRNGAANVQEPDPITSMLIKMTRSVLSILTFLLYLAITATGLPTAFVHDASTPDRVDEAMSTDAQPHHLLKRHENFLICGKNPQDPRDKVLRGPEDIKLSRKCLGAPYYYTCDEGTCPHTALLRSIIYANTLGCVEGDIDHYTTLGQDNLECNTHCKVILPAADVVQLP